MKPRSAIELHSDYLFYGETPMKHQKEIVVLGFPKCGTSALVKSLSTATDTQLLRTKSGALEVPYEALVNVRPQQVTDDILIHKYAAYMFAPSMMRKLFLINPDMNAVLCYRDPERILISWWNFHRLIAKSGDHPTHFAYKERVFYENCSIEDYYETFAKSRMCHTALLTRLLKLFPADMLVAVEQEAFAKYNQSVSDSVLEFARTGIKTLLPGTVAQQGFKGFADTVKVDMPEYIQIALRAEKVAFKVALQDARVFDLALPKTLAA